MLAILRHQALGLAIASLCLVLSGLVYAESKSAHGAELDFQEETPATDSGISSPAPITDKQLRAAWKKLSDGQKKEASDWFFEEARQLPIFQNQLVQYVKGTLDKDPYDWPKTELEPVFDPRVHAPAQPIPRVPLSVTSSAYQKEWERLVGWRTPRRLSSAWEYSYGQRTVRRVSNPRDPERLFENGLQGFVPDLDLCEALCQMALDDGELQASQQAFDHVYAIRTGASFPGISLYEAWSSGRKLEMPDVECLGIIHTLLDDWKTWVAPVSKQKPLYNKIETLYVPVHRARSLQTSLARTYLIAAPVLHDGYQGTEAFLHHLWEENASSCETLLGQLPPSKSWEKWMKSGQKKLRGNEKAKEAAQNRVQHLAFGEYLVRSNWIRVLQGMGTLAK